jgi:hypothetical protein
VSLWVCQTYGPSFLRGGKGNCRNGGKDEGILGRLEVLESVDRRPKTLTTRAKEWEVVHDGKDGMMSALMAACR